MEKLKKNYLFLFVIVIMGIIVGIIFANILSIDDEKLVYSKITSYFNSLKEDVPIDYIHNLVTNIKNNMLYIITICIMGISIIGLLINNFIVFFKGFILGFTIGSIINIYLYSGIVLAFVYVFPFCIFNVFILIVMTYYANDVSLKIFDVLFRTKEYQFKLIMKRYLKIFLFLSSLLIVSSVIETFVTPLLIKLFSSLIK